MIKNNRSRRFLISIALTGFLVANAFANVKLPAIFSDKMILQQQTEVTVWGWADPGEQITISGSWSAKVVSVKANASGNWKMKLPTPKAGGPYILIVKGNNNIQLNDVLIGEVWFCSGQSNMAFTLKSADNAKEEITKANFPTIRYFSVKRQYGPSTFADCPGSTWEKTSSQNAGSFSAVAYYFAKKLQDSLHVPVGIIYSAWGGTPAEAWTPNEILKNNDSLSLYINRWKKIQSDVGKDSATYHKALDEWETNKKGADSNKIKKPSEPQTLYYFNRPWREPGVLFNGMINPIIPFCIKGVLWYQGESNVAFANEYYHLFSSMIQSWRGKWNQNNLPFYFVQIAPFGYSNLNDAAQLRESQYQVMQNISNTGMAVTIDLGNMKDIHFTHKKEVGDRLALIALAKNYQYTNIIYKGPEIERVYTQIEKVIVEFKPSLSPLTFTGNTLKGFEIGYIFPGSDSAVFVPGSAKISGNKIIVWNDDVKFPAQIRYAWLLAGNANLSNKEGLPAFPFRKDIKQR